MRCNWRHDNTTPSEQATTECKPYDRVRARDSLGPDAREDIHNRIWKYLQSGWRASSEKN